MSDYGKKIVDQVLAEMEMKHQKDKKPLSQREKLPIIECTEIIARLFIEATNRVIRERDIDNPKLPFMKHRILREVTET